MTGSNLAADPALGLKCRFCGEGLTRTFLDLGVQPLANSYVDPGRAATVMEPFYPLHVRVCERCLLVQLPELATAQAIFADYAYLSSTSSSWLEHSRRFAVQAVERFGLQPGDLVVEVASNDGYLLRHFVEMGHRVLGIEPATNVAAIAEKGGVPTLNRFFGTTCADELVSEGKTAKLLVGNNVLAHVPDINDFVEGLRRQLAPAGVLSMEFPHLLQLMRLNQFDTIYHEHFSYLSLRTVTRIFAAHGLQIFDVETLPTHGGSLRVLACREDGDLRPERGEAVARVLAAEEAAGLGNLETYLGFTDRVQRTKWALLELLIGLRRRGKRVVAYGAPAKGNTLLNYCGIRSDLVEYTVDRNPLKQGKFLPGTRIPIRSPDAVVDDKPDVVLILPWNLEAEIVTQMASIREWGGQFLVPIPEPRLLV
jgi:SAM-dependent methyltransferase